MNERTDGAVVTLPRGAPKWGQARLRNDIERDDERMGFETETDIGRVQVVHQKVEIVLPAESKRLKEEIPRYNSTYFFYFVL